MTKAEEAELRAALEILGAKLDACSAALAERNALHSALDRLGAGIDRCEAKLDIVDAALGKKPKQLKRQLFLVKNNDFGAGHVD
jgi:hypothetical protein